jgi:hypothetical protein
MNVALSIDRIEQQILELRIEFERFFNGDQPTPPETLRQQVQAAIRTVRNSNQLRGAVDQFRLTQVEARFNSYSELFNRRVREREEGRKRTPLAAADPRFDAADGVVVGERLEPAAVEALYEALSRGPGPGPRFDLESFRSYLGQQLVTIRKKTGCDRVQFRLLVEDGKTKLKARPLSGSSARSHVQEDEP